MSVIINARQSAGAVPATAPMGNETAPAGDEIEPILCLDNIQGNIIGGFNKDFQTLVFLTIDEPADFKVWLATQVPFISTASEVMAFNNLFKAVRKRRKREGHVKATWLNVAFNYAGIKLLTADAEQFQDKAFVAGLPARAAGLNDPVDADGRPIGWAVGATDDDVHVVFIVAADDHDDMTNEIARLTTSLTAFADDMGNSLSSGARITFVDEGRNLPAPLGGHEHFGTHDGISQPGVRGRVQENPDVFITPRQNPNDRLQGKPGQDRLWPGEFVFGYEGQNEDAKTLEDSKGDIASAGPDWSKDGSFLVFRRLRQDVFKFHKFLADTGAAINADPRRVSAKLVGRWPSGTPTVRTFINNVTPEEDIFAMGDNDCENNAFEFNGDPNPPGPVPAPGPDDCINTSPAPVSDATDASNEASGNRCPFIAHTRKAYPRNDLTPDGMVGTTTREEAVDRSEVTTQTHRFLRRGIPYGPVSPSTLNAPVPDLTPQGHPIFVDRGLHFLCYQTSITRGFEFVIQKWVNEPNFSIPAAKGHETPDGELPLGADPVIGQVNNGGDRSREFFMRLVTNAKQAEYVKLRTEEEWVVATGGGYFFAPSIEALEQHLTV
jgi:Dyp-type peroxidase family